MTELGIVTEVKPLQFSNAELPIEVTELGIVMLINPLQPKNAELPIEVTESGIIVFLQPEINVLVSVLIIALQLSLESYTEFPLLTTIDSKLLQPMNAELPIEVTELPIVTEVSPLQLLNALLPIEVTELGILILPVNPLQLLNALLPIEVTELGIVILVNLSHL